MSQHDMDIANQTGALFRQDVNAALQALASMQSGSTPPSVTFPFQLWADTNALRIKQRSFDNATWVTIGIMGTTNWGLIQPGVVVYHASSTAPAGYLKANGAAVSRTTYADLFSQIGTAFGAGDGSTTFNLPDLRGEFIRGWDDSRGVDASRLFGSSQAQGERAHYHTIQYSVYGLGGGGSNITIVNSNTDGAAITGGETRPRNVALLAVIKY